jgi:hypothetical protein
MKKQQPLPPGVCSGNSKMSDGVRLLIPECFIAPYGKLLMENNLNFHFQFIAQQKKMKIFVQQLYGEQ